MDQVFPQLLTEKQASHILAVSVAALRRWRREKRGPEFARVETCIRYDLRAIERFLAEHSSGDKNANDSGSVALAKMRYGPHSRENEVLEGPKQG
jgi:hypothetical protein